MFVDASAIVAILSGEPEADRFADLLENADEPVTSPIAISEAALGLRRKRHASVQEANADVEEFLAVAEIACVAIASPETATALLAFARYGKGTGHPAQLNLGDCFAYAVARNRGISILCKSDDFAGTDIGLAAETPGQEESSAR